MLWGGWISQIISVSKMFLFYQNIEMSKGYEIFNKMFKRVSVALCYSVMSRFVFFLNLVVGCFIVRKLAPHFLNKLLCYHRLYKSKFSILNFNSLYHKYVCVFQCLKTETFQSNDKICFLQTLLILWSADRKMSEALIIACYKITSNLLRKTGTKCLSLTPQMWVTILSRVWKCVLTATASVL